MSRRMSNRWMPIKRSVESGGREGARRALSDLPILEQERKSMSDELARVTADD
jgi:hypothetical protein